MTVEEIVDDEVIRSHPNRTLIPAHAVDAVCVVPRGAHPSYVQGSYDRDNAFYRMWPKMAKDPQRLQEWLDKHIHGTADHEDYLATIGEELLGLVEGRLQAVRAGGLRQAAVRSRERRRRAMTTAPDYSQTELIVCAASKMLAGKSTVFAGIGLPTLAVDLAHRTLNRDIELIYEFGVSGAHPEAMAEEHRRLGRRVRLRVRREHAGAVRLRPAGRQRRRGLPGCRADRPVRVTQHGP